MGGTARGHRLRTFHALAGNRALVRILAAYTLFTLIEYSVWLGVLVYAYSHGGATVAALVAIAQLIPAAVAAPFTAAIADRRSPVFLLAGGYLAQAVLMAAAAVAVVAGTPVVVYAVAVLAGVAVTGTRPAQATLIPSVAAVSWSGVAATDGISVACAGRVPVTATPASTATA